MEKLIATVATITMTMLFIQTMALGPLSKKSMTAMLLLLLPIQNDEKECSNSLADKLEADEYGKIV
jgi:hypothetical protein